MEFSMGNISGKSYRISAKTFSPYQPSPINLKFSHSRAACCNHHRRSDKWQFVYGRPKYSVRNPHISLSTGQTEILSDMRSIEYCFSILQVGCYISEQSLSAALYLRANRNIQERSAVAKIRRIRRQSAYMFAFRKSKVDWGGPKQAVYQKF